MQASLVKLYRAWPRLDTGADPDAYLRRIMINTHRSWWRARWRRAPCRQTDNLGGLIRYAGGYTYVFATDSLRGGPPSVGIPIPPWASLGAASHPAAAGVQA